ncbi:MAG: polysaccharide biosynthesis protein [Geminicoccaceae bacterium]
MSDYRTDPGSTFAAPLFSGKNVLVTGGTGSLGQVLVRRLLSGAHGRPASVTVLSRDEAKQHDMRLTFNRLGTTSEDPIWRDSERLLRFRVGDVRDPASVAESLACKDVVFHAAALKQVPTCEYFPTEAISTNIQGAINLTRTIAAAAPGVKALIGISTDKACWPVNVMGMSKALQERVLISANIAAPGTRFMCCRYGNVLASRGSVLPVFLDQIRHGGPVTITTRTMTRFLLSLETAVDTIIATYALGQAGEIFVPKVPAARISTLAEVLIGDRPLDIVETGIRPGEKIHEVLVARDEASRTVERGGYYVVRPALPDLHADSIPSGPPALTREFASHQKLMSKAALTRMLRESGYLPAAAITARRIARPATSLVARPARRALSTTAANIVS